MPILSSTEHLKKHLTVAKSFQFEDFEPFIEKALNNYTRKYFGELQEQLAEPSGETGPTPLNQARYFLQEAIVNFGMFLYLPLGSVQWDGSGLSNNISDKRTPLSWQQMNDIKRGLLNAGHAAMDQLLAIMENNKDLFPDWAGSDLYTQSKELIVDSAGAFNKWYNIFESRQTYLALQPTLRQVEDQYLKTVFCPELIKHLKTESLTGIHSEVKVVLQKAMVAFAVAKVCDEGLFIIEATGIRIKYDKLSHETTEKIDIEFLQRTAKKQEANGTQYLQLAKELILANPADFNQCSNPIITPVTEAGWKPYNTKSTLAL